MVESFKTDTYTLYNWVFKVSRGIMANASVLNTITKATDIRRSPEIVYNDNALIIENPTLNIHFNIAAIDALRGSSYSHRAKHAGYKLSDETNQQYEDRIKITSNVDKLSLLSCEPTKLFAKEKAKWDEKDFTTIKDYQVIKEKEDWTFTTFYGGSFKGLATTVPFSPIINKALVEFPLSMLGPPNKILYYQEIKLFEDDLCDSGFCIYNARLRVMEKCWFVLLRFYLRIDEVCVRTIDTRLFHEFGTKQRLREVCYKESNYEDLRKSKFEFDETWSVDPSFSDEVYKFLKVIYKQGEVIAL